MAGISILSPTTWRMNARGHPNGKGHLTRVLGSSEGWTVVVQVPSDASGAGETEAGDPC